MKIIEVRDGFIRFEADDSVYLSSFIQVEGFDKNYIAQVNQIRKIADATIAFAKFLFVTDNNGLQNYDRTLPSSDAEISLFTSDILMNSVNAKTPIIIGKTLDNKNNVVIDISAFDKKTLISADDAELNNLLANNLAKQFSHAGKNTVLLDAQGVIQSEKKYVAGSDFKLPLNTLMLDFMYKSSLNDVTEDSKSTIAEIFSELSEYSKSVPFVPFKALKTIVDDMVDNRHVFKLLAFKNKLAKFDKLGYFANSLEELNNFDKILSEKEVVIDLSKLDNLFVNAYFEYIYSKLEGKDVQVLTEVSNYVSKKNLKNIISDSKIPAVLIVNSKYKYINNIRDMFDNFIIEPTMANSITFRTYGQFFSCMQKGMYLSVGEGINYIPMVSAAQAIDEYAEPISYSESTFSEEIQEPDVTKNDFETAQIAEEPETQSYAGAQTGGFVNDEIINNIDEKSEEAINAVSQSVGEIGDIEIFDDGEEVDESYGIDLELDITETEESQPAQTAEEPAAQNDENEEIIEPEYTDIEENDFSAQTESEGTQSFTEELLEENEENEFIVENTELIQEAEEDIITDEPATQGEEDLILEQKEQLPEQEDTISDSGDILTEDLQEELLISDMDSQTTDDVEEEVVVDEDSDLEELSLQLEESENELQSQDFAEPELPSSELDVNLDEPSVTLLGEEDNMQDFEEIAELDSDEVTEDDIIVDMSDEGNDIINIDEELDQQIVEDVDKVYTTMKEPEEYEEISDSDLDLIDELNSDGEDTLEEYTGELEEVSSSEISDDILEQPNESIIPERQPHTDDSEILEKRESNTPIVPVYDADIPQEDMVVSDPIQQGDAVVHAKYGNGVVEKMIKYGTKTLFSINFENIGRRLLDPALTEIKRL